MVRKTRRKTSCERSSASSLVPQQVHRQVDDHALMLGHQFAARGLVAFGAALHERGLPATDLRPTDDPRLLH